MLSHATHFLQANDKSFNKIFKVNIDAELTKFASRDMNVEDHDVAYICANSLAQLNIRKAIVSSYKQVGIHPFDRDVVLKTVWKYHIAAQSQENQERLEVLKSHIEQKLKEKEEVTQKQVERKEASSGIRFGTQRTKVLTSAICMG